MLTLLRRGTQYDRIQVFKLLQKEAVRRKKIEKGAHKNIQKKDMFLYAGTVTYRFIYESRKQI